jgi:membrane protein
VTIAGFDVVATAKETIKEFQEDDLQGRAAEVAYKVLFSVAPLLIFLTALSGFIARAIGRDDVMRDITNWLFDHMGTDAARTVRDPIEQVVESSNGGLLSFGAIFALWGGKNATAAIMKALNVAFDVDEARPWLRRNAVAVVLTIALGLAVVLTSTLFIAGAGFADNLTSRIGLGATWRAIWSILRWPVIAAILSAAVAALYWAAPNVNAPFRWLTPGSVWTVGGWGIATLALGFYFAHFAGYAGGTYGALGGVMAFLFWLYVMTLILLFGAELNAVVTQIGTRGKTRAPAAAGRSATPRSGAERQPTPRAETDASVPRGTYTRDPAGFAIAGGAAWSVAMTLSRTVFRVVRGGRRLRSYAASRDLIARR